MANTIQLKRSSSAGAVPAANDLAEGELALNTADGEVFLKSLPTMKRSRDVEQASQFLTELSK